MENFWLDNAAKAGTHVLVDLGYGGKVATRKMKKLLKLVGIKNFQIRGQGRLLLRIPPTKVQKVLSSFPIKPVEDASGYIWCTHTWIE